LLVCSRWQYISNETEEHAVLHYLMLWGWQASGGQVLEVSCTEVEKYTVF
jgi:hypothetical protein